MGEEGENIMYVGTVIAKDDTWLLWAIIILWATVSLVLEQRYRWASTISGAIIALVGAMACLLYTSPSPRDLSTSRMPSSA